ncbi:MAG: prolyl oligopeptidase family serine peptidase, partial [Anaerolineae bacterium]
MSDSVREWAVERRVGYPAIEAVALSPDGGQIICAVQEPLLTDDKSEYIAHLYRTPAGGGALEQMTFGDSANRDPQWSPDGRFVAFVSKRSGRGNLYAMRADGGEAWPLTHFEKSDVSGFAWAPDGRSIAFLMAEPPTEEKEKALRAKDDAVRWEVDLDFAHVYVVPFSVATRGLAEPRQVTRGRFHVVGLEWLPNGAQIALTHRPTPGYDSWPQTRLALARVSDEAGEPIDLGPAPDKGGDPVVSPDGRWIACPVADEPARWAYAVRVVLFAADGSDRRVLADTPNGATLPITWSADGSEVYALEPSGVTAQLWALPASGAQGRQLTDTDLVKTLASAVGSSIAFVGQDFHQPNAVYLFDAASGSTHQVAQPAMPADWPTGPLPRAEVIRWQSPDGVAIEGVLSYPHDYRPGQRYPLVVQVHGGPASVFQRTYMGALQSGVGADIPGWAERGYAVLQPNPRGSSGYGRDLRFANSGDWGGGDFRDIMSGVDHLIATGIVDPDRLAIQGWSYGGFMSSWAITQTDRFKAALVG